MNETNKYAERKIINCIGRESTKQSSKLTLWNKTAITDLKQFFDRINLETSVTRLFQLKYYSQ